MDLFVSFLKNRQQCVKINDVYSELLEKKSWCSPGNSFRATGFFLYINDFRERSQRNFDKIRVADAKKFYLSRNSVAELQRCVSEVLEKTDIYLKQNKVNLNNVKLDFFSHRKKMKNLIQ